MPLADREIIADAKRLEALRKTELIHAMASPTFDRLTHLVRRLLNVPVSLVSLVEADFQFFLSQVGLPEPYATARQTPLSHSFCQHAVATGSPLVIENALENALVSDNLAIQDLNVIAYLGIPLETSDGQALGSFCAIDSKPRHWTPEQIELMTELAMVVMREIEYRAELQARYEAERNLMESLREREELRLVREMTESISHDLRTPVTRILMSLGILDATLTTDKQKKYHDSIEEDMLQIRETLEEFSSTWDIGDSNSVTKKPTNLNEQIQVAISTVLGQERFSEKSPVYHLNLSPSLPDFQAKPELIGLLIANLFENAVLYSPDEKAITITTTADEDSIIFTIADQGTGISEDDLPNIFTPFFKTDKARTSGDSGSGLGLTIVRHIVQQHHAEISVDSTPDEGTQFRITFPIPRPESALHTD